MLIRQVLGAVSQFEKAMLISKLKGARDRKREASVKVEGRKSYAELDAAKWCAPRFAETSFKADMIRRRVMMTTETAASGGVGLGRGGRMSRKRKRDAVLRLLRGEDLTGWQDTFVAAGEAGLATRSTAGEALETERLKAKLGEMLQERRSVSLSRMNAPFLVPSRIRTFFAMVAPISPHRCSDTSMCHDHHPGHAEAVRDHPEARGEEGRAQGHVHVPPQKAANTRSASSSLATVRDNENPLNSGCPPHRPSDAMTVVSPRRKLACMILPSEPGGSMPGGGGSGAS